MIPTTFYSINPSSTKYPKTNNLSFGSTNYRYLYKNKKPMECYTSILRRGIDWNKLGEIFNKNFKNTPKVNIIVGACSDGSEPLSVIMALKETLSTKACKKFTPIRAFDFCEDLIMNAKRGLIHLTETDILKINLFTKSNTEYFKPNAMNCILDINSNGSSSKTYQATDQLIKDINYEQNDIFKVLKAHNDNSNTVLFFRNALIHLGDSAAQKFATLAGEKLKSGSLVIIGETDRTTTQIEKYLNEQNFKEISPNIFRKSSPSLREKLQTAFKIFTMKSKNT